MLGRKEIDFRVDIQGMSTIEIGKLTETTILQVQNNLLDRKTAIMKLNSCSEDEAEEIIKRIDKDREQEAKFNNSEEGNQSSRNSSNDIKPKGDNN
jgi:hypothetical protein